MNNPSLPADYASLLTLFQSQQSELAHMRQFVEQLLEQIRFSRHQHFGARSEAFSIDQLSLLTEAYAKVCATGTVTRLGCMAYARRKFDEALKSQRKPDPQSLAGIGLCKIRALYRIEREAKDMDSQQRKAKRQREAVPLLDDLRDWLDTNLPLVPKQSALGKALNYMHKQWPSLIVYVDHGDLRIDNNLVENVIRPLVICRKNFLFCNSVAGAHATANLIGLIETAKANKIEPYRYLRKVFTELPKATRLEQIEALLPDGDILLN